MLVIFGANGRTGREVVKAALAQGWEIRPVVRDDRDGRGLDRIVDVGQICYADPDHPDALPAVLDGATHVVSCINARTAGPGCPRYTDTAGAHIVRAAHDAGIERMLHMSIVGSFRWSPHALNRRSFRLDRAVRVLKDVPWTMMRVSCYFDEVIEGHVRPPDGRRPHAIVRGGRYAPVSRRDVGRMVVDLLPDMFPNRTLYVGGPTVYTGEALDTLVGPWREGSSGGFFSRRTSSMALPPGDVSVSPDTTGVMVETPLADHLEDALNPAWTAQPIVVPAAEDSPAPSVVVTAPEPAATPAPAAPAAEVPPPPGSIDPGPHPADDGRDLKSIRGWGPVLRRVVHDQLVADAASLGLDTAGARLDFRASRVRKKGRATHVHDGDFHEITGVRFRDAGGKQVHRASVTFLRDDLAEVFAVWFERADKTIPVPIWARLDMGVQRRLAMSDTFAADEKVVAFRSGQAEVSP